MPIVSSFSSQPLHLVTQNHIIQLHFRPLVVSGACGSQLHYVLALRPERLILERSRDVVFAILLA